VLLACLLLVSRVFLSSGVCHTGSGQSGSGQSGSGQNGSGGQSSATTVNGTSGGRPETDSLTTADVILLAENFTGQAWCPKVVDVLSLCERTCTVQ
jgi:hypothetical protein